MTIGKFIEEYGDKEDYLDIQSSQRLDNFEDGR